MGAAVAEAAGVGVVVGEQPTTKPARTAAFPRLIREWRCLRRYLRIIQASFGALSRSDGLGGSRRAQRVRHGAPMVNRAALFHILTRPQAVRDRARLARRPALEADRR